MTDKRDIRVDYQAACDMFDEDKRGLIDSVDSSVWWDDCPASDADGDAVMAAASAGWDAARDFALGYAFESLRGSLTDILPYGFWEEDNDDDMVNREVSHGYGNYADPIRTAATVATLVAQGAAFAAGVQARKALES